MSSSFKLREDRASRGRAAEKVEQRHSLAENGGAVRVILHSRSRAGGSVCEFGRRADLEPASASSASRSSRLTVKGSGTCTWLCSISVSLGKAGSLSYADLPHTDMLVT